MMALAGRFVDFAKIMTGTARLYPRDVLEAKLALYKSHRVRPFIGGQFAEFVLATQGRQAMPRFFDEAVSLGFETIEVSDNCVPLDDDARAALIGEAAAVSRFATPLDHVLSAESAGRYKPAPAVYALPTEMLGVPKDKVLHVAGSGNDVLGAVAFGMPCVWSNRSGDRLLDPAYPPLAEFSDLSGVLELL